ncbi:hypothetical protein LshimejAT787_0311510 [Lyophyllum shimeji]|uniref:Uncharacterized protein n=1 Tax=Lyophyllum shimeji TaxID=47721 RepID=A0A9P3UJD7_LYOSH|nr:hypothetical protein LshimejAT787_0311510 [Lyophyllum shimeji]
MWEDLISTQKSVIQRNHKKRQTRHAHQPVKKAIFDHDRRGQPINQDADADAFENRQTRNISNSQSCSRALNKGNGETEKRCFDGYMRSRSRPQALSMPTTFV